MMNEVIEQLNELKGTERISLTWWLEGHVTSNDVNLISGAILDLDARTIVLPCSDYVRHFDVDKQIIDFVVLKNDWRQTHDDMILWLFKRFQKDLSGDVIVHALDQTAKDLVVLDLTIDIDPYNEIVAPLGKIIYAVNTEKRLVTHLDVTFSTPVPLKHDAMRKRLHALDVIVSQAEWAGMLESTDSGSCYSSDDDFGFR